MNFCFATNLLALVALPAALCSIAPAAAKTICVDDGEVWIPEPVPSKSARNRGVFRDVDPDLTDRYLLQKWWQAAGSLEADVQSISNQFRKKKSRLDDITRNKIALLLLADDFFPKQPKIRLHQQKVELNPSNRSTLQIPPEQWSIEAINLLRNKQSSYIEKLKCYRDSVAQMLVARAELDAAQNLTDQWITVDSRVLPCTRRYYEELARNRTRSAKEARNALLTYTNESHVSEVDSDLGWQIDWNNVLPPALATDKSLKPDSNLTGYTVLARRTFSNALTSITPTLLIKIDRRGKTAELHILQSSGADIDDRSAIKAISNVRLPPLPDSYGGDHWYIVMERPKSQTTSNNRPAYASSTNNMNGPITPGVPDPNSDPRALTRQRQEIQRRRQTLENQIRKEQLGVPYPWQMVEPYGYTYRFYGR